MLKTACIFLNASNNRNPSLLCITPQERTALHKAIRIRRGLKRFRLTALYSAQAVLFRSSLYFFLLSSLYPLIKRFFFATSLYFFLLSSLYPLKTATICYAYAYPAEPNPHTRLYARALEGAS